MVPPRNGAPLEIDLRREPDPALGEEFARSGLAGPFAVITAYDPVGQPRDEAANRRRNRELAERLAEAAVVVVPIDGRSPDGSHVEPGYGVALPLAEACRLALEFCQTAVFWWDGTTFWLVEAAEGGRRVRLPA